MEGVNSWDPSACKDRKTPLYVLPPRGPKQNAFVERDNGTVKQEFYYLYSKSDNLCSINSEPQKYNAFLQFVLPHSVLQDLALLEYYQVWAETPT